MRLLLPVLAVLLCAAEVRAQEYSIDFLESPIVVSENHYLGNATVRRTAGANPPGTYVAINFETTFPGFPKQTEDEAMFDSGWAGMNFRVPTDDVYTDGASGTVTMSYTHPYTKQLITKSVDVVVKDDETKPYIVVDDLRALETEPGGIHTVTFHLSNKSAFPESGTITTCCGTATAGADYALLDTSWSFAPLAYEGQARIRIFNDGIAEGVETFRVGGVSWAMGEVTILDEDVTAIVFPSASRIMAGELFDVDVSLPPSVPGPMTGVLESADERIADPLVGRLVTVDNKITTIPFRAGLPGTTTISVSFPGSPLVGTATIPIDVYDPGLEGGEGLEPLRPGQIVGVPIRFTPAGEIVDFGVDVAPAGVVEAPYYLHIDGSGQGEIVLTALAPGKATVSLITPSNRVIHEFDVRVEDLLGIRSIAPNSAPSTHETPVTISGSGFRGRCTASFGALPATQVTIAGDSTIKAVTPKHDPATVDVFVTCDGETVRLPAAFTFTPPGRSRSVRH